MSTIDFKQILSAKIVVIVQSIASEEWEKSQIKFQFNQMIIISEYYHLMSALNSKLTFPEPYYVSGTELTLKMKFHFISHNNSTW